MQLSPTASSLAEMDQEFRSTNGEPTGYDPLCFRLKDFAMDDTAKEILGNDDAELLITMEQLCSFLSKAEKKVEDKRAGKLRIKSARVGKRKLPLEETPERPITAEDEEGWRDEEARATKRANRGDRTYPSPHALAVRLGRRKSGRLKDTSEPSSL